MTILGATTARSQNRLVHTIHEFTAAVATAATILNGIGAMIVIPNMTKLGTAGTTETVIAEMEPEVVVPVLTVYASKKKRMT